MGYRLRVWNERTLQRLAAAWRDGVTPRELAERFGYTERAIRWKLAAVAESAKCYHHEQGAWRRRKTHREIVRGDTRSRP
jgi:DeoR/GlpR family transcriptional regulator of sugar metabolism